MITPGKSQTRFNITRQIPHKFEALERHLHAGNYK